MHLPLTGTLFAQTIQTPSCLPSKAPGRPYIWQANKSWIAFYVALLFHPPQLHAPDLWPYPHDLFWPLDSHENFSKKRKSKSSRKSHTADSCIQHLSLNFIFCFSGKCNSKQLLNNNKPLCYYFNPMQSCCAMFDLSISLPTPHLYCQVPPTAWRRRNASSWE